eukprot:1161418-Pelagomonas_calceolata.AAC.10
MALTGMAKQLIKHGQPGIRSSVCGSTALQSKRALHEGGCPTIVALAFRSKAHTHQCRHPATVWPLYGHPQQIRCK